MSITLQLSPETQAELERRAADAGVELSNFILQALEDNLNDINGSAAAALPYDQWRAEFRSWIAHHKSRNPQFDDSRDSIYD